MNLLITTTKNILVNIPTCIIENNNLKELDKSIDYTGSIKRNFTYFPNITNCFVYTFLILIILNIFKKVYNWTKNVLKIRNINKNISNKVKT